MILPTAPQHPKSVIAARVLSQFDWVTPLDSPHKAFVLEAGLGLAANAPGFLHANTAGR